MILQILKWLWVSPWSFVGAVIGLISCVTGGGGCRKGCTWEFHGGLAKWLLERTPIGAIAMTVGHVILGRTQAALDLAREHELVHVRQYEAWGPLFVPVYFLRSGIVWWQGGDVYRDNPFEREAFECSERRV